MNDLRTKLLYQQMLDLDDDGVREKLTDLVDRDSPMKPVPLKYEPLILHGWEYGCPDCEKAVGFNKYAVEYTDEDPFCPSCGQKLNWED